MNTEPSNDQQMQNHRFWGVALQLLGWSLLCLAAPVVWLLVELINQEYLGFWERSLELTGVDTGAGAIPLSLVALVLCGVAVSLLLAAFCCFKFSRSTREGVERG